MKNDKNFVVLTFFQVKGFKNTYIFIPRTENDYSSPHKRGIDANNGLIGDDRVVWAEHQKIKQRYKRDFMPYLPQDLKTLSRVKRLRTADKVMKRPQTSAYDKTFNDELWVQEWYLVSNR